MNPFDLNAPATPLDREPRCGWEQGPWFGGVLSKWTVETVNVVDRNPCFKKIPLDALPLKALYVAVSERKRME